MVFRLKSRVVKQLQLCVVSIERREVEHNVGRIGDIRVYFKW